MRVYLTNMKHLILKTHKKLRGSLRHVWGRKDHSKRILFKIMKRCWVLLAVVLIIAAMIFTLFRALTPWVKQYKTQVEHQLTVLLGQPVTIQDLETSWYWFQPVLKMDQVTLEDANQHVLKLNKLLVGINLWSSFWSWQVKPGVLYVEDVHLTIHQVDSHWEIDGLNQHSQSVTVDQDAYLPIIGWLLAQDKTVVKRFSATIYLANNTILPIQELNLKAKNSHGHYRLFAHALLKQKIPTMISVVADMQLNPNMIRQASGHVYVSLQNFLPAQWQGFFPNFTYHAKHGQCNLEAWVDVTEGQIVNAQSLIHVQNFVWDGPTYEQLPRKIDLLDGNFAWKKVKVGWQLTADQLKLQAGGVNWPQNALRLEYKKTTDAYYLFLKHLTIASLLSAQIDWPDKMKTMLQLKPSGELIDTQVNIKQKQLDYVLTKFNALGWQGSNEIPSVSPLSGVVYWGPNEGRLVLDSEHTKISMNRLPPLTFDVLNLDLGWKQLNNGLRLSMDRFVLSHPNLLLSATGALDNPSEPDANLRLSMEFSAKNAAKFLAYIPSQGLKPKFDEWLKHDIKRIAHAVGRLAINGNLADFPYDHQPGEFSIVSHVSGVDLLINDTWPMNRDMDADIVVNKRSFIANIDQANLKGVLLDKVNLVIDDIGLGKESLLLHGNVEAPGNQIKRYIFASPLRDRLTRWKAIDFEEDIGLDLRLDIPLYPESDHVAALGELTFANNPVVVHLSQLPIPFDDVTGSLQFNEYGLTDGHLQGTLDGLPFALQTQAILEPKPGTLLTIEGEATTDYLQQTFASSWLNVMSGHLKITGLWTIFQDVSDADQLHIDSSMQGVAINLPKPFAKAADERAPLTVDLVFNPKGTMGVHLNYDDRLNSELLLKPGHGALELNQGEVHLGPEKVKLPNQPGLKVTGSLATVDLAQWHDALDKFPAQGSSSVLEQLHEVILNIGQLSFLGQKYDHVLFKTNQLAKNDWNIKLNQADFAADLHYNPARHLMSGTINHLYLNPTQLTHQLNASKWNIQPQDIPNLNLEVLELKYKAIDIGRVSLKTTSHPTSWTLDQCDILSSDYQLGVQGDWQTTGQKNTSKVQAHLVIKDLGKSLERWHLTPAVDARPGTISFQGGWSGPFYDFSLPKVTGKMQIVFKNGRISHLDKSTEEKLGLGKLLSILSLQTIPRRLKLDFSDLSENGYSFDMFKGNFDLKQGIMSTQDSYLDGPVAYASMRGDFDLSKKLYDVNLRITPYITASLPVVATIAGGPIAGFATWVASNLINKGMQKISGYTYKISGPWLDPVVQQVSIDKSAH